MRYVARHAPSRAASGGAGSGLPRTACMALLLALVVAGCAPGGGSARGANPRANQDVPVVAVVETSPRELARSVTVSGQVEPIRAVSVNALAAGTVLRVVVEEGDRVRTGELMAELDGREVSAQLRRAEAVLANSRAVFERTEQLRARGLSSAAELDAARSAFESARAEAELWRTRQDFTRITAPASGMVTAKRVERGGAVSANQTMFEIADDSLLVVRVRVSELDVVGLSAGREVTLQLDAYPGREIRGRIRRVFPSAEPASRLVPVEVVLGRTPPGVDARPGFLARVEFVLERRRNVLAVPTAALGVANDAPYVYVVAADTLSRRSVGTGLTAGGWVEVRSGLAVGDRVVSSGHVNLRPGMSVRVTAAPQPGPAAP